MYKLLLLALLFIFVGFNEKHLPESRLYIPRVDTGFTQYNAPSLYNTEKYVLTFDDGPHLINTPKILDILKEYNAKANFFVLTERLGPKTLPILKRMLDEGHIVSSHDHIHDHNNRVDQVTFRAKVKKSFLVLKKYYKLAGHKMTTFYYRFPFAEYGGRRDYHHINIIKEVSQELFKDNCIHLAFWDIDSGDWIPGLSSTQVFQNIKSFHNGGKYITYKVVNGKILQKPVWNDKALAGGVILQHDIQKRSIEGTRKHLQYIKKNNFKIVPMTEVDEFSYNGLNCKFRD